MIDADSIKQLISEAETELFCMDRLKPATLSLHASAVFNIIAQMQLALSHPQNNGPSAKLAKRLARQMQSIFSENSSTYKVIDLGWTDEREAPPSPEDGGVTGTVKIEIPPELEEM